MLPRAYEVDIFMIVTQPPNKYRFTIWGMTALVWGTLWGYSTSLGLLTACLLRFKLPPDKVVLGLFLYAILTFLGTLLVFRFGHILAVNAASPVYFLNTLMTTYFLY